MARVYLDVLKPGQKLLLRQDQGKTSPAYKILRALKLTAEDGGDPDTRVFVVKRDEKGLSVYIDRKTTSGGYIEALLPASVLWGTYFEATENYSMAYANSSGRHFTKVFPLDFVDPSEL